MSLDTALDPRTLEAAMRGDERAFEDLIAPYRQELHAHCYRMLGSLHDAEDALQEALLRAWRGLAGFEGRSSLRSWLYRIATNGCLRLIERRPKRVLPVDYGPPDRRARPARRAAERDAVARAAARREAGIADGRAAPEARYEQRESVELAFVAALQHLPARQRAVLILRDVLGFAPAEIADALDTSAAAVSSALQRAHKTIDERLPERSQQATLRALGDERLRGIVATYVDAWERNDVDAILGMLAEDAAFAMPPRATWFRGREAVRAFLHRARSRPGTAGGWSRRAPARRRPSAPTCGTGSAGRPMRSTSSRSRADGLISDVTAFMDATAFPRFGLPDELRA